MTDTVSYTKPQSQSHRQKRQVPITAYSSVRNSTGTRRTVARRWHPLDHFFANLSVSHRNDALADQDQSFRIFPYPNYSHPQTPYAVTLVASQRDPRGRG